MLNAPTIEQLGSLGPTNFLRHAVALALSSGVPLETVVLLLLLPVVAALIAAARYLVGLRGFGIFTPVMLAVVLMTTGVLPGIGLFLFVLAVATSSRILLRRLKIHYLARMALVLWVICLGVFAGFYWLRTSIFPLLILILLSENFVEVQLGKSLKEAMRLTAETLILSLGCVGLLQWTYLRQLVLSYPEGVVLGTAIFDLAIGRFTGMRLLEYHRFRSLLKKS